MAAFRICLLGGFEAWVDSQPATPRLPKKALALLGYVSVRPGHWSSRDKLAELLWGDGGSDHSRHSLRQALVPLRRWLARISPEAVVAEGERLALNSSVVDVDVSAFERLAAEGTPASLEGAASLYRGELLDGLNVGEPAFQEWLAGERQRLRELAVEALARLLQHQRHGGALEAAIQTALRLLRLDRTQEVVHRTLIRLYARQGRRGEALRQYLTCVGVLRGELGLEPEPETQRLYRQILQRPAARRGEASGS